MARFKITGNSPFTGEGYGMEWLDGVAYTSNQEIADYLKTKSYKVEALEQEAPAEVPMEHVEASDGDMKTYTCPHCGKVYKTQNGLAKHIHMDHPESSESLA